MATDSRASWAIAAVALCTLAVSFGSPYLSIVALKAIAAETGGQRAIPALANSLAWLGAAIGGIAMGQIAERIGVRWTVAFGGAMICIGLILSSYGEIWQLYVGHGLFIGLLGNAGINAPLMIYISKWFGRRRGVALAMVSSGQYVAGALWPPIFERMIAAMGWRQAMFIYGLMVVSVVVPLALIFFRKPPAEMTAPKPGSPQPVASGDPVLGLPANVTFGMLIACNFLCCVPMAMPTAHLIAFCGEIGMTAAKGAAMLSLLLTCAVVSRQLWGLLSDRIGGLRTIMWSSGAQLLAVGAFFLTQDEVGLFMVAAAFGLGYSGLIPAYVLAIRQLFPPHEMSWRVPVALLFGGSGMAVGGWLAGYIYDQAGFYAPAFATGLAFNALNFAIIAFLVWQSRKSANSRRPGLVPA
ncbi:MAG: MFS transporter [Hyphomicrobiaceae bacterium]